MELFKRCQLCGEGIIRAIPFYKGAQIVVGWECVKGHSGSWYGGPEVRRMPLVNLILSAGILFSGNTFSGISRYAASVDLKFFKPSTYNTLQNTYLLPVVDRVYTRQQNGILAEMILKSLDGISVSLIGDGRSDSPGYSAKYTTYTMMEEETQRIVDMQLVQVSETTSSVAMEKVGFKRSVETILDHGITVSTITTDRSPSISKIMREEYPTIQHQYDVWHICKGIKKKLLVNSRKKGNEDLTAWIRSVTNHFWYSCATCDGDVEVLKRKWFSVLNHVVNIHNWVENGQCYSCEHNKLSDDEIERKKWLNVSSPGYQALCNIVKDSRLLRDMSQSTLFKHTGSLECYHNAMLKFVPKRIHFPYAGMRARAQLAVIDHNANVGRKQAVTKNNDPRFKVVQRKQDKGVFKVKKIFEPKNYFYVKDLMKNTIERRFDCNIKLDDKRFYVGVPDLPRNIYQTVCPPREAIIVQKI